MLENAPPRPSLVCWGGDFWWVSGSVENLVVWTLLMVGELRWYGDFWWVSWVGDFWWMGGGSPSETFGGWVGGSETFGGRRDSSRVPV